AVLRVATVDVVGTHVYAPRYAFGRNATSQPGQTRDPPNVGGRKSVLQCRIGDIDMGGGRIPRKRKRAPLRARQVLPCLRALGAQDGTSIAKQAGMSMFGAHAACRAVPGYRGRSQLRPAHRS